MKTLSICLLLLLGVLCSVHGDRTIPFFIWSDNDMFSHQNAQVVDTITSQDIEAALKGLLLSSDDKTFVSEIKQTPEVVVLFLEARLETDQISHFGAAYDSNNNGGSFSSLKTIMESSTSSLTAPYVISASQHSLVDLPLSHIAPKMAETVVIAREEGTYINLPTLKKKSRMISIDNINAESKLFTNGKADLIVVYLSTSDNAEQFASHDATISKVSKLVSTATSGNYVGIYTGNAVPYSSIKTVYTAEQPQLYDFVLANNNTNCTQNCSGNITYMHYTYLPGPILEVGMVLISLITMVFVGICNLCNLQTPEAYENPKVQRLNL